MKKINLAGAWRLRQDKGKPINAQLPGCTYLDYINNGMADPFWGENETGAKELARHDYTYTREFIADKEFFDADHIELVATGLDTLCTLTLNGFELGKTNNISRTWRFNVKKTLRTGQNTISILIENPYPYAAARYAKKKLTGINSDAKGSTYLRKTPCHFGWDWGPKLPPAGLTGSIEIESYTARIEEVRFTQNHTDEIVTLNVEAKYTKSCDCQSEVILTAPDGQEWRCELTGEKNADSNDTGYTKVRGSMIIKNPRLWWPNGLGDQTLYTAAVTLRRDGVEIDEYTRRIGLRTIELDTHPDELGRQFRFKVNGVPIFAKGANWIPADSFVTRVTKADYSFYIESAKHACMNMLRVWGGGMYEHNDFYSACDENGILVWQDFIFACGSYPFYEEEFLSNVRYEVEDNIRRLRHHASLAVWCGNNENEILSFLWKRNKRVYESNRKFYHETLRDWTNELDGITPYWPGSPSSGYPDIKPHRLKPGEIFGDTHLWQIWHGMQPIEAFRNYPTRFCSEFGMESMPSMHTVRMFTDNPSPKLFDPVMLLHQKSRGGNEKILFYMLAKYRNPVKFEDFVYLSQLVQSDTVRFATDNWRRNIGKQNGSLFWQYNDCWPVASWAGIDYGKQYKAVQYHARHFNKMICLSNDYFNNHSEIYVINETPENREFELEWTLYDFRGTKISSGGQRVESEAVSSVNAITLWYNDICKDINKTFASLKVKLKQDDEIIDEKNWLLVPDKEADLQEVKWDTTCTIENGIASVTLRTNRFARYTHLTAEGVTAPWSDNFFDIIPGESITVTVPVPSGMTKAEFTKALKIKSLVDVEAKNSIFMDRLLRWAMIFKKNNWITWLLFKAL